MGGTGYIENNRSLKLMLDKEKILWYLNKRYKWYENFKLTTWL